MFIRMFLEEDRYNTGHPMTMKGKEKIQGKYA